MLDIVSRNADQLAELVNKILSGNASPHPEAEETAGIAEQQETAPTHTEEKPTEELSILIVDDNADIRTYLRTILAPFYTISEAADGKQGLEIALRDVPDLIVSDVMMPVMNGLEFCQQVKDNLATSHIPVILLTARALSAHQIEGFRSGADAYITKPFEAQLLLARIENLLRSRQVLKDLWAQQPVSSQEAISTEGEGSAHDLSAEDASADAQATQPTEENQLQAVSEAPFLTRFKAILEKHLTDSDLSVEDLGTEVGLSRVQLYRKVKALTGRSPVELLRTARLQRARQMLLTTDKTISEVAYDVGFSAPSYFTKCFRDEFGISPSELTNKQ
jgi:DNA-binding response OmpR family regulator